MCRAGLTASPHFSSPYTLNSQPRACSHQNNLLNLHERCEANKKLASASFLTPIGATFWISTHRVGSYIFSKSCKLSLSKSRLTPVLSRQRHSYTPQLRSNNCHQSNKLSTNSHPLSDYKERLLSSAATIEWTHNRGETFNLANAKKW